MANAAASLPGLHERAFEFSAHSLWRSRSPHRARLLRPTPSALQTAATDFSQTMLLRIRTKDGTERVSCDAGITLSAFRQVIAAQFSVPIEQQALARGVQAGRVPRKGEPFGPADEGATLSALGVGSSDILFLDYQVERENQEKYVDRDPFKNLAKEGELRREGKKEWTLTNYLEHRATKEFVLKATPDPHAKFVQIDQRASQALMNFMIGIGFGCKRFGYAYGRWCDDDSKGELEAGVQVHAIYEPAQDCTSDEIVLLPNEEGDAKAEQVAAMLGLTLVGVVIAHPAREYAFSINEILLASRVHAKVVAADPDKGKRFVTLNARPVLESEENIEGVATVEAYQMTDQSVELAARENHPFKQAKTDPRVAKTVSDDLCFVVEKKEVRKAAYQHFIARVYDVVRPFSSFLGSAFTVENRPSDPQSAERMASYLRSRRADPFLKTVSDLHFLIFLSNFLDMQSDLPILCSKVLEGKGDELEGFQMMINCYAGLD